MSDPVSESASVEGERPWRWYCRICGDEGTHLNADDRTTAAFEHIRSAYASGAPPLTAEAGHLLHVWPDPATADRTSK